MHQRIYNELARVEQAALRRGPRTRDGLQLNGLGDAMSSIDTSSPGFMVWSVVSTASMAASAYHGYKRNKSVGWAIVWGAMGAIFPVITPVIAVAEGYAKPAKK